MAVWGNMFSSVGYKKSRWILCQVLACTGGHSKFFVGKKLRFLYVKCGVFVFLRGPKPEGDVELPEEAKLADVIFIMF